MSLGFFVVGGIIFTFYVYFLIWNIFTSNRKQREENYPSRVDSIDMDGMGNYSRFPSKKLKITAKEAQERLSKIPLSTERVGRAFINSKKNLNV